MYVKRSPRYIWPLLLSIFVLVVQICNSASEKQPRRQQQQQQSGIGWAMQAMQALTGGVQVNSVFESGTVTRTLGGDQQQGSITLQSSGVMTNQLGISTGAGNLSETRSWDGRRPSGEWTGFDGQQHPMKRFNCWTDAVWFFPALSLLSDYADPNLVFTDLGQIQYSGGSAEHIQVYRYYSDLPQDLQQLIEALSTVDYYLDSTTALPVAMTFSAHDDSDVHRNVPFAVVFGQYQPVGGIQVPFQVTELLNGSSYLQITVTSAAPNGQNLPLQRH
jgi:hypothetical protein